ncbi:hypothetical protein AAG570_002356 [Ranatra chinensis]|uniref:Solute carrier organic anion transporter family member n=1 Tax=Ranatra chinensis TaxID=642074 RepID=A0ABD0Y7A9_9HEMI
MSRGEDDQDCGVGWLRAPWLQRFATTNWFLTVYGLLGTIQAMSNVYWVATLTTFEKRFGIPSRTTGIMLSGNEISQILLSLFLTYYGGQRNRPLWIGWGVALFAVSCYILALPHFMYGPGQTALSLTKEYTENQGVNQSVSEHREKIGLCSEEVEEEDCVSRAGGKHSTLPAILVFLSQFILGIGSTLYVVLGQTYIDDNAKKTKTPMLLGMTISLKPIGHALGFLVGSACLSIYINPSLSPVIDKKDPRWLGAWWLGWLLFGTVMLLFAILMALFPKDIKQDGKEKLDMKTSAMISNNMVLKQDRKPNITEFPAACKRLFRNKLLIANIFSDVAFVLGFSGHIMYLSKYLEVQFNKSPSESSLLIGPMLLVSEVSGLLISGFVISKFKPPPSYLLGWNVVIGFILVFSEIFILLISCKDNGMVGYNQLEKSINFLNDCNKECGCDNLKYSPVCLEEYGMTFYSSCHAGCSGITKENGPMFYHNCTCVPISSNNSFLFETYSGVLKNGPCPFECGNKFGLFITIMFFVHWFGTSGKIGNIIINYRSVEDEDKPFAHGISLLFISMAALVPGPILYGWLIDSTCLVWNKSCGSRGNCWYYDKDQFRYKFNGTAAGISIFGVILDIIVCRLGKNVDLYGEEERSERTKEFKEKYGVESETEGEPLKLVHSPNRES